MGELWQVVFLPIACSTASGRNTEFEHQILEPKSSSVARDRGWRGWVRGIREGQKLSKTLNPLGAPRIQST
jgi:hypothetical protein